MNPDVVAGPAEPPVTKEPACSACRCRICRNPTDLNGPVRAEHSRYHRIFEAYWNANQPLVWYPPSEADVIRMIAEEEKGPESFCELADCKGLPMHPAGHS